MAQIARFKPFSGYYSFSSAGRNKPPSQKRLSDVPTEVVLLFIRILLVGEKSIHNRAVLPQHVLVNLAVRVQPPHIAAEHDQPGIILNHIKALARFG